MSLYLLEEKPASIRLRSVVIVVFLAAILQACEKSKLLNTTSAVATVTEQADRFYAMTLELTPELAYSAGINPDRNDGIEDISPDAQESSNAAVDDMLQQLESVDPDLLAGQAEWITHAYLLQHLRDSVAQRVCRYELWSVNHMAGWHTVYTVVAQLQPTGSPSLREQSLARWSKLAAYVDQHIVNLKYGLELGYSAPHSVVQRVIVQVDGLLALELERSPFFSPALRDDDESFVAATRDIIATRIVPALRRYREFLANTYISSAREELSITANPNGRECYEASVRAYTTLDRSGKEIFELGKKTVAANKATVVELGVAAYGSDNFRDIIRKAKADPTDRFATKEQLLEYARAAVTRAEEEMPNWVGRMPQQTVTVVPFAEHEEGTGMSAHYRPGSDARPAEYRIPLHQPEQRSRGNTEATAFHEAWPGHHLQVAVGQAVEGLHPVSQLIWFSGPGEGWARYAEGLSEEMGLYTSTTGPILRRAWPARGMVVDPGIHLFGWTNKQAVDFMLESGRFSPARAADMLDRIAMLPGQLTAYDSGGLEILALRREAENALGENFDIREFHDRILENGTIPLVQLRTHIEVWLAKSESHEAS